MSPAKPPRGIIFDGESVRGILAGVKTQTRRVAKLSHHPMDVAAATCPYGSPGERLWVRETWTLHPATDEVFFRATDSLPAGAKWRSALFLPKVRARLWLQIMAVRSEPLHAITPEDGIAEGAWPWPGEPLLEVKDPVSAYRARWLAINGQASWDANPLVWVVSFQRSAPPAPSDP